MLMRSEIEHLGHEGDGAFIGGCCDRDVFVDVSAVCVEMDGLEISWDDQALRDQRAAQQREHPHR